MRAPGRVRQLAAAPAVQAVDGHRRTRAGCRRAGSSRSSSRSRTRRRCSRRRRGGAEHHFALAGERPVVGDRLRHGRRVRERAAGLGRAVTTQQYPSRCSSRSAPGERPLVVLDSRPRCRGRSSAPPGDAREQRAYLHQRYRGMLAEPASRAHHRARRARRRSGFRRDVRDHPGARRLRVSARESTRPEWML